jgi:hypothetical protein
MKVDFFLLLTEYWNEAVCLLAAQNFSTAFG